MEAYEVDLNRYMDKNEKIERALFELEYELYDDIDNLNKVVMKIQELTDLYELESSKLNQLDTIQDLKNINANNLKG